VVDSRVVVQLPPGEAWPERLATVLGPVTDRHPIGSRIWRATITGHELVVKTGAGVEDEAEGLRRLALVAGAPPVPEVVLIEPGLLVTPWIAQATRTAVHDEALGRVLAHLHSAPGTEWGGGSSWVGECRVDPRVRESAADLYGSRLRELAARCGLERSADVLANRIGELLPAGDPVLLHGDLWWGNVLWGADGRPWLIDPSIHGGHAEEDLAMLGLFGAVPERTLRAYTDVLPLAPGWQERVALFQLYPLLVHTVLFGGGYRERAAAILRRFTSIPSEGGR
jgi:fructosamine-3-kinase